MKDTLKDVPVDDLITKATAARLRGVSRSTMHELIEKHNLTIIEIGEQPFVRRSEVQALPARTPKATKKRR
jgi:excisionase family DNA binding protein